MKPTLPPIQHLLIIVALATAAAAPVFLYGITSGPDLPQHFQFARTIHDSLAAGDIYPGYGVDQNGGLGDVGLRFYPPLTYYVLSLLQLIVGDWFIAVVAMYVLVMAMSGLGIYLWVREYFSPAHALFAAGLFTFAPYHLSQFFQSFLLAEFMASAIVPFCFLFVTRVARRGSPRDIAGLAAAYGLLILTHLPSTVIVSICLTVFSLLMIGLKRPVGYLMRMAAAVALALASTSFYWWKMVTEMPWVKHSYPEYFTGSFDFRINFLLGVDGFLNYQNDPRSLWFANLMLTATILAALPALILILKGSIPRSRFILAVAVVFLLGVTMATPISSPIWEAASIMQKVQFPWRWISVVTPFAVILATVGIMHITGSGDRQTVTPATAAVGLVLAIFVFTTAFLVKGAVYMSPAEFSSRINGLASEPSYIAWWPLWATVAAVESPKAAAAGSRSVTETSAARYQRRLSISAGEPVHASYPLFYYPHWRAEVNGLTVETLPDSQGRLSFDLPPEAVDVTLRFVEPPAVQVSRYASGAGWVFILLLGIFGYNRADRRRD